MSYLAMAARRVCAGPLALALLAATLLGCGSPSVRTASSPSRTEPPAPNPERPHRAKIAQATYEYAVIARAQRRQLTAFPLLRTRPEGLPKATQKILRAPMFGVNWRLAQRIPVRAEGTYWLVPGDGHLCVVSQGVMGGLGVGSTCATTGEAIAHGIADVSITFPGATHRARLIVGVAPAGTREVHVETSGAVAAAPVRHEVFVMRDRTLAAPDAISLD